NVIAPFATIGLNTKIGNANIIGNYAIVGHDCIVGNYNFISSYSSFGGFSAIGNGNFLAHKATLTPRTNIQDNCTISANSVISKYLKSNKIALGNPATIIGENEIFDFN
ncbi:LbetaH domain-containing protein, partial [Helicobacter muridarum]